MVIVQCDNCGQETQHQHLYDTAYGILETYMAGTERFKCTECDHVVYKNDPNAKGFKFVLD